MGALWRRLLCHSLVRSVVMAAVAICLYKDIHNTTTQTLVEVPKQTSSYYLLLIQK